MYPNERDLAGSTKLFAGLHNRMLAREVRRRQIGVELRFTCMRKSGGDAAPRYRTWIGLLHTGYASSGSLLSPVPACTWSHQAIIRSPCTHSLAVERA